MNANNLEYLALVGGYGPGGPTTAQCETIRQTVQNRPTEYPNYAMWTVGNEIGWDDGRTAEQYVQDFIQWRSCLKNINSTFRVGTGAIVGPQFYLPQRQNNACIDNYTTNLQAWSIDQNSGANFFRRILQGLKIQNSIPDMIVTHAYSHCQPGGFTADNFKTNIEIIRTIMKDEGMQNVDLVIKEFNAGGGFNPTESQAQQFLSDTIRYMTTTRNQTIGNPNDDYKLVQRFAWFVANEWKNSKKNADGTWACNNPSITPGVVFESDALFNTYTGVLKPLGQRYQSVARELQN